jgi:predicted CXXCH cytochrome family protein
MGDGLTYGFSITGHGKASGNYTRLSWQATTATGNPAANRKCSDCHDLTSTHFNNAGDRLKAGYENDNNNSNCKQCHDPGTVAVGDPQWYTTYTDYQNSAHSAKKCSECHDVHGASGNYPGMTKANQESLCYQCHTDGVVQNNAISGASLADDIQQAFSLTYKHDLGTSFTVNSNDYTLECISCHNVHIVTGKYWEADQGKSPVTRFTNNTEVWGDDAGEKMDVLTASLGGVYQKLDGDPFVANVLPDYVTFCQDCHGDLWNGSEPHGPASADTPVPWYSGKFTNSCPDWNTCGYYEEWPRIPLLRGYQSGSKDPYSQEQRIAGVNYILSCLDCHEAHGSQFDSNFRTVINNASVSNLDWNNGICNKCHWHNTAWHATLSCGSASCHDANTGNSIHRMQHNNESDSPATKVFNSELVFDLQFEEDANNQFNCIVNDSGDFNLHGMFLPRTYAPFNEDNNIRPSGCEQYYVNEGGNRGQVLDLDGTRTLIMGATRCTSDCWAPPTWDRGTYALFEMKYNVTVMAWIKPVSYPPSEIPRRVNILGNEREGTGFDLVNYGLSLVMVDENGNGDDPDDLRLDFHVSVGNINEPMGGMRGAYSSVPIPLNKWTFVAATFDANGPDGVDGDPSTGRIRIYVNGQDVTKSGANLSWMYLYQPEAGYNTIYSASDAVADPDVNCDAASYPGEDISLCWQPFTVGGCGAYTVCGGLDGPHFDGRLDGIRVYNVTKTQAEIQAIFDSELDPVSLQSAVASDASGRGYGIQAGDQVVIRFDGETNGATIDASNIDTALALSDGHTWLDGSGNIGSAVWSSTYTSNDTLTITLSTVNGPPTVTPGDIITLDGTIKDGYGNPINQFTSITGNFGSPPDGAAAYWKFDEGSGSIAADSIGSNDGIISGAGWTTSGRSGNALSFNGVDSYVDVDNFNLSLNTTGTWEAWVYAGTQGTNNTIMQYYVDDWNRCKLSWMSDNRVRFNLRLSSNWVIEIYSDNALSENEWHHYT